MPTGIYKRTKEGLAKQRASIKRGKDHYAWKGGRRKRDKRGYIIVYCPNHPYTKGNFIYEHRLLVEKAIGRYLLPNETVHHINEDKTDNRLSNLIVFNKKGYHAVFHLWGYFNLKNIIFDGRKYEKI